MENVFVFYGAISTRVKQSIVSIIDTQVHLLISSSVYKKFIVFNDLLWS